MHVIVFLSASAEVCPCGVRCTVCRCYVWSGGRTAGAAARAREACAGAGVRKLRPVLAVPLAQARAGGRGEAAGGPWEVPLMTSHPWRHSRDVRRRDIATSLGGGGLSNAPTVHQRAPSRALSRTAPTQRLTEWVSARAVSGMCSAAWGSCWANWDCRARASVWPWSRAPLRWTPRSLRQVSARTTIAVLLCLFSLSLCRTSGCCRLCGTVVMMAIG